MIANERALTPVLAKARTIADGSRPFGKWLEKWEAKRAAVFRAAKKHHRIEGDSFAGLLRALRGVPVPPPVEFDNRRSLPTLLFESGFFLRSKADVLVVTPQTLAINGRPFRLGDLAEVQVKDEWVVDARVTLLLRNGEAWAARIRREDVQRFTATLRRFGVRCT